MPSGRDAGRAGVGPAGIRAGAPAAAEGGRGEPGPGSGVCREAEGDEVARAVPASVRVTAEDSHQPRTQSSSLRGQRAGPGPHLEGWLGGRGPPGLSGPTASLWGQGGVGPLEPSPAGGGGSVGNCSRELVSVIKSQCHRQPAGQRGLRVGRCRRHFRRSFLLRRKMSRLTLTLALLKSFITATPSYWSCRRSWGERDGLLAAAPQSPQHPHP